LSKRVLIADDSFGDRMILRDYLMSFGYRVVGEAKRGRESVEKFRELKPDLVVLDAAMPDMDGVSVVRELLREEHEAIILVCVANGQRALAVEALGAGARDFITKPIDSRRLRRVLHQASYPAGRITEQPY
jgi:two-component system chemotaxis response regulator CheY